MAGCHWMSRRMGAVCISAVLCVALSAAEPAPKKSVSVETLLPANACLYLSCDGKDAHRKAWEQTAAYDAFDKTGVLKLISKLVTFAADRAGEDGKLLEHIYRRVAAKGLSAAVPLSSDPLPMPALIVVLHGAAEFEPALTGLMRKAANDEFKPESREVENRQVTGAIIPDSPGVEVSWFAEGEHLVVVAGFNAVESTLAVITGEKPNLSTNALWKSQRAKQDGIETTCTGWLDVTALRKAYGALPIPNSPNPNRPLTLNSVLTAVGLGSLEHIAARSGIKGRALWTEVTARVPGPKRGLMTLFDQKVLTLNDLPPLPSGSRGFILTSLDAEQLCLAGIDVIRKVAELGPPSSSDRVEESFAEIPQALGFDPLNDLCAALGHNHCLYDDPHHGLLGFGCGLSVHVKDPMLLKKTIDGALERLAAREDVPLKVQRVNKAGSEITVLQLKSFPLAPAFAIDRGRLIVSLMPQGVEAYLMRLDKKLPTWKPDEAFEAAMKEMPKEFMTLGVTDPRQTYPTFIGYAPLLLTVAQMALQQAGMGDVELPIHAWDIPPAEQIVQPLFPEIHAWLPDPNGIRFLSRSAAPPFVLLDGSGGTSPEQGAGKAAVEAKEKN